MKTIARWLLAGGMVFAGLSHLFWARKEFQSQVPDLVTEVVPIDKDGVVVASGAVEIMLGAALVVLPGCAVSRGQSTVGQYVDDTAITTAVKARFVEAKSVDATAISVETLNGTVMLSGFAKNATEKGAAESLARSVNGVKEVRNEIVVRM